MLLAAASFGLSAAPEFAEMPVGTDGAWLIRGRGEVDAKLGRGPAGGREEAVSLSYDFSRCPDPAQQLRPGLSSGAIWSACRGSSVSSSAPTFRNGNCRWLCGFTTVPAKST